MKVLHIINSLITGGAESLLVGSLPLYEKNNVSVDVFLLNSEYTHFYKELKDNFKGNIYESSFSNIYNPLQISEIKKYITRYDLIHVHLFPSMYWVAFAKILSNSRTPLIFTEHSTHNRRMNNKLFTYVDRKVYCSYNKIISITPQVKEALINTTGIEDSKIKVIFNGVDINKHSTSSSYSKIDFFDINNNIILIQVANFNKAKDQKTTIESLLYLPENYSLLLVGDGDLRGYYEKLVVKHDLRNRVLFLGNRYDIPKLLKTSDIVIQSSNWEGFGLSAVEGMASGKPVIASNVPGLNEVVENAGLIFAKNDSKDLAEKILLLSDKKVYSNIVNSCYQRSQEFDLNFMVKKYIELYYETVK